MVTDDMPFLIDTITMTLATHDVTPELVVHPQLLVRRDVTGELHEVLKSIEGPGRAHKHGRGAHGATVRDVVAAEPDLIAESWSHIEVARLTDGKAEAIEAALDQALANVRMAVEDYPKMRAMAVRLADQLASAEAARVPRATDDESPEPDQPESPAEIEELLRWLIDAHFTFLGYREYDLVDEESGPALRGVPGTGLGILRHDKTSSTSLSASCRRRGGRSPPTPPTG